MNSKGMKVVALSFAFALGCSCSAQMARADEVIVKTTSPTIVECVSKVDIVRAKLADRLAYQLKYGSLAPEECRFLSSELSGVGLSEAQLISVQGGLTETDEITLMKKLGFIANQLDMELNDRLFAGKVNSRNWY